MYIVSVIQHIKIGDLSQSGMSFSGDEPDDAMDEDDVDHLPEGTELGAAPRLSRSEERSLVRDSTASFPGTSIFYSRLMNLNLSSHRLGRIPLPSRLRIIREPTRRRWKEEHYWWKTGRKCSEVNQEHDGRRLSSLV